MARGEEEAMSKTLPQAWQEYIDRDMGPRGFGEVLKMDPFGTWGKNQMPEASAERECGRAIDIACAYPTHQMIESFLGRALDIAKRALAEKPLDTDREMSMCFPGNRGKLLRVQAYATALQNGSALDLGKLRQASGDLVADRMLAMAPAEWDNVQQCQYLVAVQLALVCGDIEHARSLLQIKCDFTDLELWVEGLTDLVESLQPMPDGTWRASRAPESWTRFFDLIRDPTLKPPELVTSKPLLRLEASLITDRYMTHPGEPLDWKRVLAGISQ
jgi:hypothetical protein